MLTGQEGKHTQYRYFIIQSKRNKEKRKTNEPC